MTEMNPFKATHVLRTLQNGYHAYTLVMAYPSEEEEGAFILYDRDEWNCGDTAGYEMDANGKVTLWGNPVSFCLAPIIERNLKDAMDITLQDGWYKSHSKDQIREAFLRGLPIALLDTSSAGGDDVLIGDADECMDDVLAHHGLEDFPTGWHILDRTAAICATLYDIT